MYRLATLTTRRRLLWASLPCASLPSATVVFNSSISSGASSEVGSSPSAASCWRRSSACRPARIRMARAVCCSVVSRSWRPISLRYIRIGSRTWPTSCTSSIIFSTGMCVSCSISSSSFRSRSIEGRELFSCLSPVSGKSSASSIDSSVCVS